MSGPLTFWHVAGDIIWRGDGRCVPIEERQAEALREQYSTEARAAYLAGDREASAFATRLWLQLTEALDALALYRRVLRTGAPWPTHLTGAA